MSIVLGTIAWCALLAYVIFAANRCGDEQSKVMLSDVEIRVSGGQQNDVVTPEAIEGWLKEAGYDFNNIELRKINTDKIRETLLERGVVKKARIFSDMNGKLTIEVEPRNPVMRVNTADGYNFYVTDDLWILPMKGLKAVYVPVVTGAFALPFEREYMGSLFDVPEQEEKKSGESYSYLLKLINFVKVASDDPFWNSQIVQINITNSSRSGLGVRNGQWNEPEVELIPRIGKHIVLLGTLDDSKEKLDKLMLFYRKVLDNEGWDKYSRINLRYKGQIVCTE